MTARAGALAAALAFASLLADCAPAPWQRSETPPYQTQNDIERCWAEANSAIGPSSFSLAGQPSFGIVRVPDGKGGQRATVVPERPGADGDLGALQERRRQYVAGCMKALGYTAGAD